MPPPHISCDQFHLYNSPVSGLYAQQPSPLNSDPQEFVVFLLLQDAVVKGWFRTCPSPTDSVTNLHAVVMTALEIASAMEYLHINNIIHGVSGHELHDI